MPKPTTTRARIRIVFDQKGDFAADRAAEAWCAERSISVGAAERGKPRGLLYGDFLISKWHNMSTAQISELHGRMTGDARTGPITIDVCDPADAVAPAGSAL